MNLIGILGIIISLVFLVVGVYRGFHVLPVTLLAALIAIVFNSSNVFTLLQDGYLVDFKNFVGNYLLVFFLGALLGQVISKSGAATQIATTLVKKFGDKNAVLMTMIIAALLSYGGISVFVIVFAIYPIALRLYEKANLPQRFIPGNVMLGAGTFVMTAMPGSPALSNIIPTTYLNTTATAAPLLGVLTSIFMAIVGYYTYAKYVKHYVKRGEVFDKSRVSTIEENHTKLPTFIHSLLPLVVTIGIILGERVIKTGIPSTYVVSFGLLSGVITGILVAFRQKDKIQELLTTASTGSIQALVNTSSVVGLGGTIKLLPIFQSFVSFVVGINIPALLSVALSVNLIAGITGSSSAGLTIFMESMSSSFLAFGIHPQIIHRVAAIASGVLDSLPHAGPNVTFLSTSGLSFREGYPGLFVATCVVPCMGLIFAIVLATFGIM